MADMPGYDAFGSIGSVLMLTLAVVAVVQIVRSRTVTGATAVLWIAAVLVLPLIGSLAWFACATRRPRLRPVD